MAEFFTRNLPRDINRLYVTADWHIGDLFYDPHAAERMAAYINGHEPGILAIPGDLGRYFTLNDRLLSFDEVTGGGFPTPMKQAAEAERILEGIDYEPDLSFVGIGNHEQRMFKKAGNLYTEGGMLNRLKMNYMGFEGRFRFKWEDGTRIDVLITHGKGTNQHLKTARPGMGWREWSNAGMFLRDKLGSLDLGASDLYIKAHEHRAYYYDPFERRQIKYENGTWVRRNFRESYMEKPVWAACCGSLGKTRVVGYTTYQEEGMMGLSDIAMLDIEFVKEGKKRIPKINIVYLD